MTACLMTSIMRLSGIVRQLINPSWSRKMIVKMVLSFTHARTSCVHSKGKPEDNPTLLFGMWHKIHLIWITHVASHSGIEKPVSILFFPWHTCRLGSTFLWQAKPVVVQNTSRRLLVSKQEFIWKPLRHMPATRTSNQMVFFNSLGSTSF